VDYVGVSRRITDDEERTRLKKAAGKAKPRGYGVIVRTAAEGKDEDEISSEIKFLVRLWRKVKQKGAEGICTLSFTPGLRSDLQDYERFAV